MLGIGGLDREHPLLHQIVRGTLIALEGELHVVGRDRVAIVKPGTLADDKLVAEAVLGRRPRFGEARRQRLTRHRLHHRIMERVHHHEGGDDARCLRRVKPCRGQRDVHAPNQLPLRASRPGYAGGAGDQPKRRESESLAACDAGLVLGGLTFPVTFGKRAHLPPPFGGPYGWSLASMVGEICINVFSILMKRFTHIGAWLARSDRSTARQARAWRLRSFGLGAGCDF
jgi:hypothetical protein